MLYSIIVGLNNKAVSLYQELGSLQISSLLVRNALTGDATLIESFIFLEKKKKKNQTRLLNQVLPLIWFSKPKCIHATCLEGNAQSLWARPWRSKSTASQGPVAGWASQSAP